MGPPNFIWNLPNLNKGGTWFLEQIMNLNKAYATYPNTPELYDDGIFCLDSHRLNYSTTGPDLFWLQLLWWEFPHEHWEDI